MRTLGSRGPVPKRSDERIRRNKDEVEITKIDAAGQVDQPPLDLDDPHPMIVDFWDSLGESAQSRFYEPSDWQFARFTLHFADGLVKSGRPSSQMLAAVNSALNDLLVSEGQRRRVRMEIEREQAQAEVVDLAAELQKRMKSS